MGKTIIDTITNKIPYVKGISSKNVRLLLLLVLIANGILIWLAMTKDEDYATKLMYVNIVTIAFLLWHHSKLTNLEEKKCVSVMMIIFILIPIPLSVKLGLTVKNYKQMVTRDIVSLTDSDIETVSDDIPAATTTTASGTTASGTTATTATATTATATTTTASGTTATTTTASDTSSYDMEMTAVSVKPEELLMTRGDFANPATPLVGRRKVQIPIND